MHDVRSMLTSLRQRDALLPANMYVGLCQRILNVVKLLFVYVLPHVDVT